MGDIDAPLKAIAVLTKLGGGSVAGEDTAVTASWGSMDRRGAVMPGAGRTTQRDYSDSEAECRARGDMLGSRTNDVFINGDVFWRNIPDEVWSVTIGGYQVLKKWLSYRQRAILGRALSLDEINHFRDVARRLAALRLIGSELDANYRACADNAFVWRQAEALGPENVGLVEAPA